MVLKTRQVRLVFVEILNENKPTLTPFKINSSVNESMAPCHHQYQYSIKLSPAKHPKIVLKERKSFCFMILYCQSNLRSAPTSIAKWHFSVSDVLDSILHSSPGMQSYESALLKWVRYITQISQINRILWYKYTHII